MFIVYKMGLMTSFVPIKFLLAANNVVYLIYHCMKQHLNIQFNWRQAKYTEDTFSTTVAQDRGAMIKLQSI